MGLAPLGVGWVPLVEEAFAALGAKGAVTGLSPPTDAFRRLATYFDELVRWNRRTDLTAARSAGELVDLGVADALVMAAASADDGAWTDVGSGAGAPGIALAVLLPGATITLVEPRDRRVAFLRTVVGKLVLPNVRVERARSDRLPDRSCDVAVSRATLRPGEWLAEGSRLSRRWVWLLVAEGEAPDSPRLRLERDVRYALGSTGAPRRALRYMRAP